MTGASENYKHRGIIPRAISQIFRLISERPEMSVTVRVSYLEIYNETLYDLLSGLDEEGEASNENLVIIDDKLSRKMIYQL
jgi:kinesin family protein 6/9